jgi:hypothetical protein
MFPTDNQSAADPPDDLTPNITQSPKSLFALLLTSATFRLILSSLLSSAQGLIASTEKAVEDVAGQVEAGITQVEKVAGAGYFDQIKETGAFVWEGMGEAGGDNTADRLRDEIVTRVQQTLLLAHRDPDHISALRTMLAIIRKYSSEFTPTTAIKPTVDLDIHLTRAFDDLKILLERGASGTSLDPLIASLRSFMKHLTTDPPEVNSDLHAFFTDLGSWFDAALDRAEYITSREGTSLLQDLYDRARMLLTDSEIEGPSQDMRQMSSFTSSFVSALSHDRALTRLTNALDALSVDTETFRQDALTAPGKWREELWRDLVAWVVPKILKALRNVPMPRVEYMDRNVDLALDSFVLASTDGEDTSTSASASFPPDRVELQNWNEVPLGDDGGLQTGTRTTARIHVDGLRVSATAVGYYLRYKGWWMGYSDEGVLDVSVGGANTDGLVVDIDLETDSNGWRPSISGEVNSDFDKPFFVVTSVHTIIPELSFTFSKSKHWILNKLFVRPILSGSIGKKVLGGMLEGQTKSGLEALEGVMRGVRKGAESRARARAKNEKMEAPVWRDYWEGLLEEVAPSEKVVEGNEVEEPHHLESNLTASVKGIVHTSTTQPITPSSSPPTPSETVLAIGAGTHLFPRKGGPYNEPPAPSPAQVAGEAMDEVREAAEDAADTTRGVVEGADDVGRGILQDVEGAGERFSERESVERQRTGWRSSVFDL